MINAIGFLPERTFIAVGQAVYSFALFLIAFIYLIREARTNKEWFRRFGNQLAIGIALHMAGETFSRAWGAVLIVLFAHHVDIGAWENRYPVAFAGAILSLGGVLWKVHTLSPAPFRAWLWWALLLVSFGLGAVAAYVPKDAWFNPGQPAGVSRETSRAPRMVAVVATRPDIW